MDDNRAELEAVVEQRAPKRKHDEHDEHDDYESPSQEMREKKMKKRKKQQKAARYEDADIDEKLHVNLSISKMDPRLTADFFARQMVRYLGDLSTLELEERRIPGKCKVISIKGSGSSLCEQRVGREGCYICGTLLTIYRRCFPRHI